MLSSVLLSRQIIPSSLLTQEADITNLVGKEKAQQSIYTVAELQLNTFNQHSSNSCFLNRKTQGSTSSPSTKASWLQEHDAKRGLSCHPFCYTTGTPAAACPPLAPLEACRQPCSHPATGHCIQVFQMTPSLWPDTDICECQGRPSKKKNTGQGGCKWL